MRFSVWDALGKAHPALLFYIKKREKIIFRKGKFFEKTVTLVDAVPWMPPFLYDGIIEKHYGIIMFFP